MDSRTPGWSDGRTADDGGAAPRRAGGRVDQPPASRSPPKAGYLVVSIAQTGSHLLTDEGRKLLSPLYVALYERVFASRVNTLDTPMAHGFPEQRALLKVMISLVAVPAQLPLWNSWNVTVPVGVGPPPMGFFVTIA